MNRGRDAEGPLAARLYSVHGGVAPLLVFLDRRRIRYDITSDIDLDLTRNPRASDREGVLFAGTNAGVFRSLDAGATWSQVSLATGYASAPSGWSIAHTGGTKFVGIHVQDNHVPLNVPRNLTLTIPGLAKVVLNKVTGQLGGDALIKSIAAGIHITLLQPYGGLNAGASIATKSPGSVTACRHRFNASRAPLVITSSSSGRRTPATM